MFKKFLSILFISIILAGCTPTLNSSTSEVSTTTPVTVNSVTVTSYEPTVNIADLQKAYSNICLDSNRWTSDKGPYVEINNNKPFFKEPTSEVFENYSELDSLGRCGIAYANICKELQPTEKRGSIGMVKPSGWKTSNYNDHPGLIDGNYLYNRCHLIGFQLAGENANEKNLITGTRYSNVTGMLPFENMVDDYIEKNPNNHVMYRVTPMYNGNDLVAQGVLMEAYSVEDNGKLQFCVWCYNVQPDISIDYATGDNYYNASGKNETTTTKYSTTESNNVEYVLNTKSKKIHKSNCKSVKDIKEQNKEITHKSIEELKTEGYSICGICKP